VLIVRDGASSPNILRVPLSITINACTFDQTVFSEWAACQPNSSNWSLHNVAGLTLGTTYEHVVAQTANHDDKISSMTFWSAGTVTAPPRIEMSFTTHASIMFPSSATGGTNMQVTILSTTEYVRYAWCIRDVDANKWVSGLKLWT